MSMKWKLRKDKVQADAPDPANETPASAEVPADNAALAMPPPDGGVFDLSGAAFAPPPPAEEALPPVEDEPAAEGEGLPHFDALPDADPRFEVNDDALSFLTAPDNEPLAVDPALVANEMAHADAGPQGFVLPAAEEEDPLSAFAPYRPAAPAETTPAEFAALDDHADAMETTQAPPLLGAGGPSPERENVAPGLVSEGDFGLPRVAPFVIDLPPSALPPSVDTGPHRLVLRLGNLSAAYDLNRPVTTIGRPDSATQNYPDIEIELDDGVSRRHAEVRQENGRFFLVDVGSTNGTILNGEMLAPQQPVPLAHGDRIRVGERTEIVFE